MCTPPTNFHGVDVEIDAMYGFFSMLASWASQIHDNHLWVVPLDDGMNLSMPRKV